MIRYIDELSDKELAGTALVRIDLNTADHWRLDTSMPTLRFLMAHAGKVVIMSHRGRPILDEDKEGLSLRADTEVLSKRISRNVVFINTHNLSEAKTLIAEAEPKSVFLLENVRFWDGEEKNDVEFAQSLAALGDYYVNDAFAVSHRENASIVAITKYIPSYGGLRLREEIMNLFSVMGRVEKPFVVVLGGAKPETKLPVLNAFRANTDAILVGGLVANILLGKGAPTPPVIMPTDFIDSDGRSLDIGAQTIEVFVRHIQSAKTILWNGPMGMIEDERYAKGTEAIAQAIAQNTSAFTIAGGGETVMTIRKLGLEDSFSFISTGGGAMLSYLAGDTLPGIAALEQ